MNEKITQAIQSHVEKNRLVFWYDDDGKHQEIFEGIAVSGKKLTIENNEWWIKYHVLQEEPKTHFLIYAPYAKPEDDRNWLLDLNLGHFVFASDLTETFRNELGLPDSFRHFISERLPFFQNSRERMAPLLELVEPQKETESSLALKIMGIILSESAAERLSHWSFGRVLFSLIEEAIRGSGGGWGQITKYKLDLWFREELKPYLAEVPDDMEPAGAAISIYRNAYRLEKDGNPDGYQRQCRVILHDWRSREEYYESYRAITRAVEKMLDIAAEAKSLPLDQLEGISLFPAVDSILAHRLIELLETSETRTDDVGRIAASRISLLEREKNTVYWVYRYLLEHIEFIRLLSRLDIGSGTVGDLWKRYSAEYMKLDRSYRTCLEAYNNADSAGSLATLQERIEERYIHEFLQRLAEKWDAAVNAVVADSDPVVPEGVLSQRRFFDTVVAPYLSRDDKVVVIISDAMRYEVGSELAEELNRLNRVSAEISEMVSVLPSETKFGMNALLPHRTMTHDADGSVMIDGKKVAGVEGRATWLGTSVASRFPGKKATARKASDILPLTVQAAREQTQEFDLLYLYSDGIDAVGDHSKTESGAVQAVRSEIDFIVKLVKKIGGQMNRTHIVVTADHGFLYQASPVNKVHLLSVSGDDDKTRRYVLGDGTKEGLTGLRKLTAASMGLDESPPVSFAEGLSRIRKQGGGNRYVHGGLSLQEMCVPVVRVRIGRSDDVKPVGASIMKSTNPVITTPSVTINIFQEQPVSEKRQPLTLAMRFESSDGTVLSDTASVCLDSDDSKEQNRSKGITLHFGKEAHAFNGKKIYLVLYRVIGGTTMKHSKEEYRYQTMGERDF